MKIKKIKNWLHTILKKYNYDIIKIPYGDLQKRMEIVRQCNIQTIFDVGANIGEFAAAMREAGYKHRIISFEPRKQAFLELQQKTINDPNWQCVNIALGNSEGTALINVAGNQTSSSLLAMSQLHVDIKPHSRYIGHEEIVLKKLDSVIHDYIEPQKEIYLKIDTQGYEKQILQGAETSLPLIRVVQLEMSLAELYRGGTLIYEMIPFMESKGFFLSSIERGFHDKNTGRLLQVDGIFIRIEQLKPDNK
jgi:FkbM family methyltransferase